MFDKWEKMGVLRRCKNIGSDNTNSVACQQHSGKFHVLVINNTKLIKRGYDSPVGASSNVAKFYETGNIIKSFFFYSKSWFLRRHRYGHHFLFVRIITQWCNSRNIWLTFEFKTHIDQWHRKSNCCIFIQYLKFA